MSSYTGFFPAYGHRRKQVPTGSYHVPLNNQQHHPASLQSARSSIENSSSSINDSPSSLPSILGLNVHQDGHRPYRRNDFANNHLFLAKRKLARLFVDQPSRNLQATSDLIHLFDQQEPKRKQNSRNRLKRQDPLPTAMKLNLSSTEQDIHLSVVNLDLKPPYPTLPNRDPLLAITRQLRAQTLKVSRPAAVETTKNPLQSNLTSNFADNYDEDNFLECDELSNFTRATINPFDSSLLCVKSIIPSIPPTQSHHHLVQHR